MRKLREVASADHKQDYVVQVAGVEAGDKLRNEQAKMHDSKSKIQIKHIIRPFNGELPEQIKKHPDLLDQVQVGQERAA